LYQHILRLFKLVFAALHGIVDHHLEPIFFQAKDYVADPFPINMDPVSLIWQVFRYAGIALEVINDIFNTEPLDLGDR
jgi:hypothetical protein